MNWGHLRAVYNYRTINNNKENQQKQGKSTSGKQDLAKSDYVILEQPVQSPSLEKYTEETLQLLITSEHNQTINISAENQQSTSR